MFTLNSILTELNQQQQVGGIFYYLAKVFDCVFYKILLGKLFYHGILYMELLSNGLSPILLVRSKSFT